MRKLAQFILLVIALLGVGCGGGGGGGSTGAQGGVGIFMTDDLNTGYSAVWVTVFKVELARQGGGFVTVFDDPNGKVVNLRALNDGSARYAFLGRDTVPAGTYVGMRFTLDKNVRLRPTGSGLTQAREFDDVYINTSNSQQAILSFNFGTPKIVTGATTDLVADFVLASWTENGLKVQNAVVAEGAGTGLTNPSRHEEDRFKGTVTGLSGTSPNFSFTLNLQGGTAVTVNTNTNTAVFNHNGSQNPELANGKRVEVRGTFDPTTRVVVAASVKIKTSGDNDDEDEIKGVATVVDANLGTFNVAVDDADGFLPTAWSVLVTTSLNTRYFSHSGVMMTKVEFFSVLSGGGLRVEAEGTWNSSTNTLAAVKVKLEDEIDDRQAEAKGLPGNINEAAGTFTISLTEWEGFAASSGTQINIVTGGVTRYRGEDGEALTKAQFFAALSAATGVKAKGVYSNGTIQAVQLEIKNNAGGEAEAEGSVFNVNASAKTFSMLLFEWEGFSASANQQINVVMDANATYRGFDGSEVSASVFFTQLTNGRLAEVKGTWNASTQTLTAIRAKIED
jgi:hypothetical protein